jgi:uncharacterized protein (TIGR00369 family)
MAPDQAAGFKAVLEILRRMYQDKIPFNRLLGLEIERVDPDGVELVLLRRPALIGNYVAGTLHGGVISSVLDATGGLMASIGLARRMVGRPLAEIADRFTKVGTIDLRIDYLRPGRGASFTASAAIMRTGNKVAVTRMEFHNDQSVLLAVGTGTYLVG